MHYDISALATYRSTENSRDGYFWQFLISIIDRFQKRFIEYSGVRVRCMAVMEITKISEDVMKMNVKNKNMT